ncbi:DUF6508 domain-containing protein [Micrococcus sp. KRD077]
MRGLGLGPDGGGGAEGGGEVADDRAGGVEGDRAELGGAGQGGPQTPTPQRVAAVRALRELLAAGYGTEARPIASYGAPAPGTLGGVYPDYDDRVFPGLVAAQELAGIDVDYLRNVDRVSEAGIAEASLADLGTLFTYLVRGERFADGHVAAAIENGKVGRMLDRLTALVPEIR